jgi:tryptophan-rich sensory protein
MNNIITFLPFLSIFITGIFYPVGTYKHRPVFQPPNWFFSVAWTYITLSLGFITNKFINQQNNNNIKKNILTLFIFLLFLLNGWLVLNHYKLYKESFWLLIISCFTSIVYIIYLSSLNNLKNLIWFLLPLPFWLVLASCLNGVIYDYNK